MSLDTIPPSKKAESERLQRDLQQFLDAGKMTEILSAPVAPPTLRGQPHPYRRFNSGAN